MSDMIDYLKRTTTFFKEPMCPLERLVLELGKDFTAAPRPRGLRKQADRECFRNATNLALKSPHLEYVEGYAIHDGLFPMFHAWCVDEEGLVVDVTWSRPERSEYRGVIIPRDMLLKSMVENKYYGVLDSGIGVNMKIIKRLRGLDGNSHS